MFVPCPVIYFSPGENHIVDPEDYILPLYKTSKRAGQLSTTGHSTNFIIGVECPTLRRPDYWVLKGAALISQLDN